MDRILRIAEVVATTGLSRSTIYERIAAKRFPAPVRIGIRAVGWRASEVTRWLESAERSTGAEKAA